MIPKVLARILLITASLGTLILGLVLSACWTAHSTSNDQPQFVRAPQDDLVIEDQTQKSADYSATGREITLAPDGSVWAATACGVAHFNGEVWHIFTVKDGLASDDAATVDVAQDGTVWVGTREGISRFNGTGWRTYAKADGLPDKSIRSVKVGLHGQVWASTCSDSAEEFYWWRCSPDIGWFDGTAWHHVAQSPPGLSDGTIPSYTLAAVDHNGRPWLSYGLYGIEYLQADAWVKAPGGKVSHLRFALDGSRWALQWGSLWGSGTRHYTNVAVCHWLTDGRKFCYATTPFIPDNPDDASSPHMPDGLSRDSLGQAEVSWPAALANQDLGALAIAPDGSIWVATHEGLAHFDQETWRSHSLESVGYITAIEVASDGSIWAVVGDRVVHLLKAD